MLILTTSILRGQPPIPPRPSPPKLVNDLAHLLSGDEANRLEQQLTAYDDSTSTQIAIVTLPDLGDYAIEDWAVEIGKKWGVGRAAKNNGIVIIVGLLPKKRTFIATGPGVSGFLPDVICKRIIESKMNPNFREQHFYEGFNQAFQAIRGAAKGEFINENYGNKTDNSDAWFWFFIVGIVVVFIIFTIIRRRQNAQYGSRGRSFGNSGIPWIFWGGGGGGFGGGSGSDSGGGGFGGFGGGDFDGGGAGGDW